MRISDSGVSLKGADPAGLYYGMQTLSQLLESASGTLPNVEIYDAPDFEWRGYAPFFGGHFYNTDTGNLPRYRKIVDEMAKAKLNRIAFESEAFATDEELESFGRYCRDRFIEPVPLHPFLCMNHRNVVAYVKASDADFMERMRPAERAIRILNPRFFGIAGDELVMSYNHVTRGSIYSEDEIAERAPHEWFACCLNRMHDYLKQHGVRMAMWADGFLDPLSFRGHDCEMKDFSGGAPDNHSLALDLIPRDILLWDWQYTPVRDYASMDYLLSKGFQVVGGVILSGASERLFPEYALRKQNRNFLGMMSLTWAGKQVDEHIKPGTIKNCGEVYWHVGHYTAESSRADSFRMHMQEKNPLKDLPAGESVVTISGPGERFALFSSGRIYCSLRDEGIGAWHPSMHLFTDVWFDISAAGKQMFKKMSLHLELNGIARCELFVGESPCSAPAEFRKVGEIRKGDKYADFDLSAEVAGAHSFCIWMRVSENDDYNFLREMKLVSQTVPARCGKNPDCI